MMRAAALAVLTMLATLAPSGTRTLAAEAASGAGLEYIRLYTGADGVSHFSSEELPLAQAGTTGVLASLAVNRIGDSQGVLFARLKAGATEDWHIAPRRQFMVCVRGLVEITAGDGAKRRLKPGQFMLLEDTTGKGHRTHALGKEDHVALAVPVPDSALIRK